MGKSQQRSKKQDHIFSPSPQETERIHKSLVYICEKCLRKLRKNRMCNKRISL